MGVLFKPTDINISLEPDDFEELKKSLDENDCIAVHFDVPNVTKQDPEADKAEQVLKDKCVLSQRDEFAKGNFLMDLTKGEEEILANMHKKHRYNNDWVFSRKFCFRKYSKSNDTKHR